MSNSKGSLLPSSDWRSSDVRSDRLRRVSLLLFQELGPHTCGIDFDEGACAGRQHLSFGIADFGGAEVFAAVDADLPALRHQLRRERNRADVVDLHGSGDGDDSAQLADLAHGLVEDGGDDASMRVHRRPLEAPRQHEVTDKTVVLFVQMELEVQAVLVFRATSETIIAVNVLFDFVSWDGLGAAHVFKDMPSAVRCQPAAAHRSSQLAGHEKRRAKGE